MAGKKKATGRPFKKGISGNPKGRPPLPPQVREFRKLTLAELQGYICEIKDLTRKELESLVSPEYGDSEAEKRSEQLPALRAWVLAMAWQGVKSGDHRAFDTLMDRVVGRVADQVNIHAKLEAEVKAKSEAELLAEARALIKAMEERG